MKALESNAAAKRAPEGGEFNLKANWSAMVPTMVTLGTVLFTALGFLATRSYFSAIGIPEHANVSVTSYLQYGGRFFFVLAVHVLPVSVGVALLLMMGAGLTRISGSLHRLSQTKGFICLLLLVVAFVTVSVELWALQPEPVFSPGKVHDITQELRSQLYLIEMGVGVTLVWVVRHFQGLWSGFRNTFFQKTLLTIALMATMVAVLLFPLCFGQIAMVPRSFDRVSLRPENGPVNLRGILVFSDADNYFLFTDERRLVEVSHQAVKEIHYESRELLQNLANH